MWRLATEDGVFEEMDSRLAHLQGRRLELLHIGVPVVVLVTYHPNGGGQMRDAGGQKNKGGAHIPVAGEDATHLSGMKEGGSEEVEVSD